MAKLDAAARKDLADSDYAYIDSNGGRHLPIEDENHVRAAMARFNQTSFESDAKRATAHAKILAAAKRMGIDVKTFAEDGSYIFDDAGGAVSDGPTQSGIHVNQPVTNPGQGATGRKRSPLLKRLMQGLRTRARTQRYLSAEDIETEYRSALGHAGGTGKRADEPSDWELCPACAALPTDEVPSPDCTCPACQSGDPDDCLCAAVIDDEEDEVDPSMMAETSPHIHSESGDAFRVFLPIACAEPPQWIPYLPTPGTFTHPRYGKIEITPERNRAFVDNFHAGVYQSQLPLDAEHQTKLSGAVGWIREMRQNLDGSVDARVDWTPRGKQLVASDQFKYVSPEWYDAWSQPETGKQIQDVAIGGALTTRPFFKESSLRPLVANETGFVVTDDGSSFSAPSGHSPDDPDHQESEMTEPTQLTEDEIKRFREIEAENAAYKQAAEAATEAAKTAGERVAALEAENRRRSFAEEAKAWTGDAEKHVSFMESLTDEQLTHYREQMTATSTALTEALDQAAAFRTVGVNTYESGSALDRLNQAAEAIRKADPKLSNAQAWTRAMTENPALYAEYEQESARN